MDADCTLAVDIEVGWCLMYWFDNDSAYYLWVGGMVFDMADSSRYVRYGASVIFMKEECPAWVINESHGAFLFWFDNTLQSYGLSGGDDESGHLDGYRSLSIEIVSAFDHWMFGALQLV